jgi:hypothetical protein
MYVLFAANSNTHTHTVLIGRVFASTEFKIFKFIIHNVKDLSVYRK